MHEESLPHIFKKNVLKTDMKSLFFNKRLDLIIFTNYSQQVFFKKEFGDLPYSVIVLPNGVEIEKFKNVSMSSNYVITYSGGFNKWKNVDLLFEVLSILEEKYTLRIAGGKGDLQSELYIDFLINKFDIDPRRVDYLGFVNNKEIATKVLNKSNLLLIPLGDNVQSRYLTSPMKLFEYMATKIPILAVNFPSISLITDDTIYLSSVKAIEFANKVVEICEHNSHNFDSSSMNNIAKKYSYKNRSLNYYRIIENGIF
jgi:glycosyltransferase involved in cell wall biosynthesis